MTGFGCCDDDKSCWTGEGISDEEFDGFCKTPENIAKIPAGRLKSVTGGVIYVDGAGVQLTREQFKALHGVDPEPVWARIKERQKRLGKKGGREPVEL